MKQPVLASPSHARYSIVGPIVWILSLQYFIVQIIVAADWSKPYSILYNTISDLGNTTCGTYRASLVCSPSHAWMNASFILLGLTTLTGSCLLYRSFRSSRTSTLGIASMGAAGAGTLLVGLFPENTISDLHILGAAVTFLCGNIALLLIGLSPYFSRRLRIYTIGSGIIALIALALFFTHQYAGIGIGGMERITAYPQTIWLIIFGTHTLRTRLHKQQHAQ